MLDLLILKHSAEFAEGRSVVGPALAAFLDRISSHIYIVCSTHGGLRSTPGNYRSAILRSPQ